MRPKLNLSTSDWEDLLDFLVNRACALEDYDHARTGYTGRGERDHGIGFIVPDISHALRLAAALAEAWAEMDTLTELAADGYGVHDFLRDAREDSMGHGLIVYFPGHKAQAL
jgi:hypothetical protein